MLRKFPATILLLLAVSCNKGANIKTDMQLQAAAGQKKFTNVKFDSDIDLVCRMSLIEGITDTVHYKEKVYGFCVDGCKSAFLANPSAYSK